ncbi:MAG: hypothetical protein KAR05_09210 [Candidatus Omnitrophica bacterium]|nr:hypothetical protein [Candidatus Omnitrophota bacterium]
MKIRSKKALSLIEVIVAIIVVGIVSVSSWIAVSVLMRSSEHGRNRTIAVNLLQKSQEEVKRIAQVDSIFDDLQNCVFPPAGGNDCGLADITDLDRNPEYAVFDGYTRTLDVSLEEGSSELKRALITVAWDGFNQPKQMQSIVLLSRPPEPLPGSIHGSVLDESGNFLEGARIKVVPRDGSGEYTEISQGVPDSLGANYNFANPSFELEPGAWILTASHSSYYDYAHPDDVVVESNISTFVGTFNMEKRPDPATIRVQLIDDNTGLPIAFNNTSQIRLYEEGAFYGGRDGGSSLVVSDIQFDEDTSERTFTANSNDAFSSDYVGNFSCGGFSYNGEGWSSSVVDDGGTVLGCANPWNGNDSFDRITVGPGDDITVKVPLIDVPMATVNGTVLDSNGNPVEDAEVYARYHEWSRFYPYPFWNVTDANGRYSIQVPAEQSFFNDLSSYYLLMLVRGAVEVDLCCEQVGTISRYNIGGWQRVGPIRAGDVVPKDFTISAEGYQCGDVEGNINNDLTGGAIFDADVIISGTEQTDGGGYYIFECPPAQEGYSIPRGNRRFRSRKPGFYANDSNGNNWYASRSRVSILEDQVADYDARMWPRGSGIVTGTVRESGTGVPINNAAVTFRTYTGTVYYDNTDAGGQFTFNNVIESWPPPLLPAGDSYYNHTVRLHSIDVTDNSGLYYGYSASGITLNNGQTRTFDVELNKRGGM